MCPSNCPYRSESRWHALSQKLSWVSLCCSPMVDLIKRDQRLVVENLDFAGRNSSLIHQWQDNSTQASFISRDEIRDHQLQTHWRKVTRGLAVFSLVCFGKFHTWSSHYVPLDYIHLCSVPSCGQIPQSLDSSCVVLQLVCRWSSLRPPGYAWLACIGLW